MSIITTLLTGFVFVSGVWLVLLFLCSFTFVQRQICYAHKAPISRGQQLDRPETFGYLKNQVAPFFIKTSDNEQLYAWLVTPLNVYLSHEEDFDSAHDAKAALSTILKLIRSDSKAKVVVYFHGNAGTVGQTRRTEAYRSITTGDSSHIYVLAFDYRGFGNSSGYPTEKGLITDALSVLSWMSESTEVPFHRVVLVAQSVGTAVAVAAAEHYACQSPPVEFGGMIVCAAFVNAAEVFMNYRVLGSVPLMAPLKYLGVLRRWFTKQMTDTWRTGVRLQSLISASKHLNLTMVQATSDEVIPVKALSDLQTTVTTALKHHGIDAERHLELGDGGEVTEWTSGRRHVRRVLLHYGGHNTIMKWAPVAAEVARMIRSIDQDVK